MLTRRQLMIRSAAGGAGLLVTRGGFAVAAAPTLVGNLRPFRVAMPTAIPVARPFDQVNIPDPNMSGHPLIQVDRYRISAHSGAPKHSFHPDLLPTQAWGYTDNMGGNPTYLGPTIVAQKGTPIVVQYVNELPATHILPVALTAPDGLGNPTGGRPMLLSRGGALDDAKPQMQTHLHGGFIAALDDGNPHANSAVYDGTQPGSFSLLGDDDGVIYPNQQEPTQLWYHDHGLGVTRLNVYAGLAALYMLRDRADNGLDWRDNGLGFDMATGAGTPGGPYEVPLIVQDKSFSTNGDLFYSLGSAGGALGNAWIPEFFGNQYVVNGAVQPFFEVEPRMYRFRVLNACNARFLNLEFADGPDLNMIGSEEGLFDKPVAAQRRILLHPAERADVIVDFRAFAGSRVILRSAPLPRGVVSPAPRMSPIMQFRVLPALKAGSDPGPTTLPASLPGSVPSHVAGGPAGDARETFVLNEVLDPAGVPVRVEMDFGKLFEDDPTQLPQEGRTEEWKFRNPTADTHPIHIHLVKFQVIGRRPIGAPAGTPWTTPVDAGGRPHEIGWKDTVGADPGMDTRVRAKFDLPSTAAVSYQRALGATASTEEKYVVHCHIVEHEDNDMMRPYNVQRTA
jgi:spore coat protein A, manganese oxidase